MSFVIATPDVLTAAATDLAAIDSALDAAGTAVADRTTSILAAGADEVSTAISAMFSDFGQGYQEVGRQATLFYDRFVRTLNLAGNAYTVAEAANAYSVQQLLRSLPAPAASTPVQGLLDILGNSALSVSGITVFQTGSARAFAGTGSISIALGANSSATAPGVLSVAAAIGNNSIATVVESSLNAAIVLGANSSASAGHGLGNTALVIGNGSLASAGLYSAVSGVGYGNFNNAAVLFADNSVARAVAGDFNDATVLGGTGNTAFAETGKHNVATVILGAGNTAYTQSGERNLSTVILGTGNFAGASGVGYNMATIFGLLVNNVTLTALGGGIFAFAP